MSRQTLSFWRVIAIQFRLLLHRGWRGRAIGFGLILFQLVAMIFFGSFIGISIDRDGVSIMQQIDFAESFEVPLTRGTTALLICLGSLAIIAWFGPFKLWEGEPPRRRDYHWAMPVAKARHDLARVVAGLGLLMGWAVVLYGGTLLMALAAGSIDTLDGVGPLTWACLFLGPVLPYLATSFFTVRMEHPTGWLWSIIGILAAITTLSSALSLRTVVAALEVVLFGRWGLAQAFAGPVATSVEGGHGAALAWWPAAWLAWFVLLSGAVVWAAGGGRRAARRRSPSTAASRRATAP